MGVRALRCLATCRHASACLRAGDLRLLFSRFRRKILHELRIFAREVAANLRIVKPCSMAHALSAVAALVAMLGAASADGVAVMDRARPLYDAKGIPVDGFRLFPEADVGVNLTDNVFQTDANKKSDVNIRIAPAFRLASEWSQHMLEFFGSLTALRYADHSSENLTNWNVGGRGRLDIRRGAAFFAGASHAVEHEGRSSPNSPGDIAEPVRYSVFHSDASVSFQPNRLRVLIGGEFDRYSYDATPLFGGGFLNNHDRDRDELRLRGRVSYEISPGYLAFVEAAYIRREFDLALDRTGVNRDSNGSAFNAGFEFELVEFLHGEVFVGRLDRHFGAPLKDFSGFNYGSTLTWLATPLTTVRLSAARMLSETTVPGASIGVDNTFGVGVDHELRRNVILQANLSYVDSEFLGTLRDDSYIEGRLGATYLIDRNLSATAGYERRQRESNAPGEDYSEDKFSVGLHVQL